MFRVRVFLFDLQILTTHAMEEADHLCTRIGGASYVALSKTVAVMSSLFSGLCVCVCVCVCVQG